MEAAWLILGGIILLVMLGMLARTIAQMRALERFAQGLLEGKTDGSVPNFPPVLQRAAILFQKMARRHASLQRGFAQEKLELEATLANMVEGLIVVNEKHVIRRVNASLLTLFGMAGSPVGQTVLFALREAAIEEMVREALASGVPQSRELTVLRGSQSTRHFVVNASPVKELSTSSREVVMVFHEITQLRQLEEVRREFVANVSHELRTPLSIFQGYVEMLIDAPDLPPEERTANLEIMHRHSLRLNALLEDLLTLARLEAKRDRLNQTDVPLVPLLERLATDWTPKLADKALRLEVNVSPQLAPLFADEARLEQILNNLLQNAVKYSNEGGRVQISASREDGEYVLAISDDGVGIPPDDLPHIFERFYRVEKARSRSAGGTGLGLAIVKHLMALHGGRAEARSEYGAGTTILLHFPKQH